MDLATIKRWVDKLSDTEKSLPILMIDGKAYTPAQILAEFVRKTTPAQKAAALIAVRRFAASPPEERSLAKERLKILLRKRLGREDKPRFVTLPTAGVQPKVYTAEQLSAEVEAGSKVGNQWIDNEASYVRKVLELAR